MRMGFKGSTTRLAVVVGLVLLALALVAVPAALAAGSMTIGGLVHAKYYAGQRGIPATVAAPDPTSVTVPQALLNTTTATDDGFFLMTVPFDGVPSTYSSYTATATALKPVTLVDWSHFFSTGMTPFDYIDGGAVGVSLTMVVKNTTVKGVVRNATTNKAITGAKVVVGNKSFKTKKGGAFKIVIGLWPATKYKATFSKAGFKKSSLSFTSNPGGAPVTIAKAYLKKK